MFWASSRRSNCQSVWTISKADKNRKLFLISTTLCTASLFGVFFHEIAKYYENKARRSAIKQKLKCSKKNNTICTWICRFSFKFFSALDSLKMSMNEVRSSRVCLFFCLFLLGPAPRVAKSFFYKTKFHKYWVGYIRPNPDDRINNKQW